MKSKQLAILLVLVVGLALFISLRPKLAVYKPIVCTQDAKACPDGSFVGRVPPRCEFATCPVEADGGRFKTMGTVTGRVNIGPLCPGPLARCPQATSTVYTSRQLVFTPTGVSRPVTLPFYLKLAADGSFRAEIPEGNYEVTLTDCRFLGCQYSLPKRISVQHNQILTLDIEIDTGIR